VMLTAQRVVFLDQKEPKNHPAVTSHTARSAHRAPARS
jgi:hypothetical protein